LELPDLPYVMISSHTQKGIKELKDILWKTLNQNTTD